MLIIIQSNEAKVGKFSHRNMSEAEQSEAEFCGRKFGNLSECNQHNTLFYFFF